MTAHAFLPPSGASSWSKCALWATMNQKFPQDESAEAIEGTAAHWTGWELLAGRPVQLGTKTPNGVLVTDEMIEGGELLADTIITRVTKPVIEQRLPITAIADDCFGTPDAWGISSDSKHIDIVDYKYGHRFVDEFWNPQGLCYLSGIIDLLCAQWKIGPGMLDQYDLSVSFTVVQPRCFYKGSPVRTHTFKLSETRPYFNTLANMAELARVANPVATTNEHCGDCPGRHACSALQLAAYADTEYSNARTPIDLPPAAAALELRFLMRALARLEARVDGLKELTISNIRKGDKIPYFRVEQGYGRRQWTIPDNQIVALGELFGKDLAKPGTLTPGQAEKAGIDPSVLKAYSFVPSTALKLVPENPTDAAKVFGNQEK